MKRKKRGWSPGGFFVLRLFLAPLFAQVTLIKAGNLIDPAEMLGMKDKRGALKPGMAADIIATPENPPENIEPLKNVGFVMKAGKVIGCP